MSSRVLRSVPQVRLPTATPVVAGVAGLAVLGSAIYGAVTGSGDEGMDTRSMEFVRLCDAAIAEARRMLDSMESCTVDPDLRDEVNNTINILSIWRQKAVDGTLPPSNGIGIGISRYVGEWADGSALWKAAAALDDCYLEQM